MDTGVISRKHERKNGGGIVVLFGCVALQVGFSKWTVDDYDDGRNDNDFFYKRRGKKLQKIENREKTTCKKMYGLAKPHTVQKLNHHVYSTTPPVK